MRKICCEKADFAEFAALPTNDRQFVIPNMLSIENWIINVEVATENYSPNSRNSRLKISLMQWRFKFAVFDSHAEYFWPLSVLNGVDSVRKIETGGCWENWETVCSCSRITRGDQPRKSSSLIRAAEYFRPVHKLIGQVGPENRTWNGTRMRSAVAEKIEKYCDRCSLCYAAVWAQCFSVFSTTADPFRAPFRFSGPTWPL